jgi:hypothetical protein
VLLSYLVEQHGIVEEYTIKALISFFAFDTPRLAAG